MCLEERSIIHECTSLVTFLLLLLFYNYAIVFHSLKLLCTILFTLYWMIQDDYSTNIYFNNYIYVYIQNLFMQK